MKKWYNEIDWNPHTITHISRHNVQPYEVEEGLFDDDPKILQTSKDRKCIGCQTSDGKYLYVVVSNPDEKKNIRIITARTMEKQEKNLYSKRKGG